ncbi:MAG: PCMD domain-containing protein [Rikenellaceae bacterium]
MIKLRHICVMLVVALLALLPACVKNDIPYPVVPLSITAMYGDGVSTVSCDTENQILYVELAEKCNIREVLIDSVQYSSQATISKDLTGAQNMKYPIEVTLSFYQNYNWQIVASQPIERYFKVTGQIGSEVIDEDNYTITAYVNTENTDRNAINIEALKLGPADITTMSLDISEPVQFITYKRVDISYYDETERWKLYVEHTDVNVVFTTCEAWATTAWLEAGGDTAEECGFYYRAAGAEDWILVNAADVAIGSGTFSTQITGLTPESEYEFKAYVGEDSSEVASRTTEAAVQMPNSGFEDWYQPSKAWFPYLSDSEAYWSTGNEGAVTLGESYNLTLGVDDVRPGSSGAKSAQLSSRDILKLAAGNLFVGDYVRTDGTNGVVGFGQKFTSRPTALKGWVKYNQGIINKVGTTPAGVEITSGVTPDVGMIYIALGTWTKEVYGVNPGDGSIEGTDDTPVLVYTRYSSTFFDPTTDDVIAYGEYEINESIDDWVEFTIPLEYVAVDRVPTHIMVVCTASKYGDYFTGSSSSVMSLDDFELVYE